MDMINTNIGQSISTGTAAANSVLSSMSSGTWTSSAMQPADIIAAEHLNSELAALDAQISSQQRAASVANVADGALGEISGLLIRVRGLMVSSANTAGKSDAEIAANQMELDAINASIDRIASSTTFAGRKLLDGSFSVVSDRATLHVPSMATSSLGQVVSAGSTYSMASLSDLMTQNRTELASEIVSAAISDVATARGKVGSFTANVLESAKMQLSQAFTQVSAARSEIVDTDYAAATTELLRDRIMAKVQITMQGIKLPMAISAKELTMKMLSE